MNKKRAILVGMMLVAIVIITGCSRQISSEEQARIDETMLIGDRILAALHEYKEKNGQYPEELADLITAGLLEEIEPPTWGSKPWSYDRFVRRNEEEKIQLETGLGPRNYPLIYSYGSGWTYDDGEF